MRNDQTSTQPMLEALLERIKKLEASLTQQVHAAVDASTARLEAEIGSLRLETGSLRQEIAALRQGMNTGFSAVHDEISVLSDDIRNARARQKDLLRRMDELESRA